MMEKEITSIRAQQRNPQRVNIYLDGEFAFGLSRITAAWLKPGRKLSEAEIDKLVNEDDREVAFQQALHYLSFRARSENEIRQNMHKKGFSIEKCKASAYVNDLDFAHQWIENRSTFRPRSIKLLSMELRQKGLPDDTINMALEDLSTPEEELAYQAALKKVDRYRSLDWQTFRNKMGSFLARRGFSYSITAPVVKRCWDELAQDPKNQNNTLDME
jgi:regulatory protein